MAGIKKQTYPTNKQINLRVYSKTPTEPPMKYWQQLGTMFARICITIEQEELDIILNEFPLANEILEAIPE